MVDLLPGLLVFGLGLSMTVAPLTATVLADADESNAGIASGVNNAIARVAGLVAVAAVGAVVAASFRSRLEDAISDEAARPSRRWPRPWKTRRRSRSPWCRWKGCPPAIDASVRESGEDASVGAFHVGIGISTVLVALGGILGLVGIRNPRRRVAAADCAGGQIAGHPREGASTSRRATGTRRRPEGPPYVCRPCGGQRQARTARGQVGARGRRPEGRCVLFMVIERFTPDGAGEIYRRLRGGGRGFPEGLRYVDSWVRADLRGCFQLMESEDPASFQEWVAYWGDLADFEIVPVAGSSATQELMARLDAPDAG